MTAPTDFPLTNDRAPKVRPIDGLWCAIIIIGTVLLYARSLHFGFINFDDADYVTENPHVKAGLTLANLYWAFSTIFDCNWTPLTWLSHMADVEMFGVHPGPMHLESALIHTGSAVILYLALVRMTGARLASAWVAAMFAWHPLHVESVAWIAERKDVLSTFFFMLALLTYAGYAKTGRQRDYWMTLVFYAMALMGKPMVITLPCVLVLLDFWPLGRVNNARSFLRMIREKWPLFLLVPASAATTYIAQALGRSVAPLDRLPMAYRMCNVLGAYAVYVRQCFFPKGLAIFYPMPALIYGQIPWRQTSGSALVLLVITILAIWQRRRRWILVGWLWFLGVLVPVIGFVQVGGQAHADRYTYVPLVGIFIALAFSARELAMKYRSIRAVVAFCAVGTALAAGIVAWRNVGYWRDSLTLMKHGTEVVPDNYVCYGSLGEAYDDIGDHKAAEIAYKAALQIRPNDSLSLNNLAVQAVARGDDEAAFPLYQRAIRADPTYVPAYNNYGNLLMRRNRSSDAVKIYRAAIKRDPECAPCYQNLALALAQAGNLDEAIELWRHALEIDPGYADAHESLGTALIMTGQTDEGLQHLRQSLQIQPDRLGAFKSLAWTLATHSNPIFQNGAQAERLAQRAVQLSNEQDAVALDMLAAAQARQGKFGDAIATAQKAADVAHQQKLADLERQISARMDLYRQNRPFTSGGG